MLIFEFRNSSTFLFFQICNQIKMLEAKKIENTEKKEIKTIYLKPKIV